MDLFNQLNKEKEAAKIIAKLALACNFSVTVRIPEIDPNHDIIHPKAAEVKTFLVDNVRLELFETFYHELRKLTPYFPGLKDAQEALTNVNVRIQMNSRQSAIEHKYPTYDPETMKRLWEPVHLATDYPKEREAIIEHYFTEINGELYPKILKGFDVPKYRPIGRRIHSSTAVSIDENGKIYRREDCNL